MRNHIYAQLITTPNPIPLRAVWVAQSNSKPKLVIVRDLNTFTQIELEEALGEFRNLLAVSKQVAEEVTQEVTTANRVTIRVNINASINTASINSMPWSLLTRFNNIKIAGPRQSGLFPPTGGPDLAVILATTPSKNSSLRQLADCKAQSSDPGSISLANAASRQVGRLMDGDFLEAFVFVLENLATRT